MQTSATPERWQEHLCAPCSVKLGKCVLLYHEFERIIRLFPRILLQISSSSSLITVDITFISKVFYGERDSSLAQAVLLEDDRIGARYLSDLITTF